MIKEKNILPGRSFFPFTAYIVLSFFSIVIWIPFPKLCHFGGASSIIYSLVFVLSGESKCLSYVFLIWLPMFISFLIVSYFILRKKQKCMPFLLASGVDLILSLLFLIYKILISNYIELIPMILGLVIRTLYYIYMIRYRNVGFVSKEVAFASKR